MKKVIAFALIASSVGVADDMKLMSLKDHFNAEATYARGQGLQKRENKFRDHLVKINAKELVFKADDYYLYSSDMILGSGGFCPILLKPSKAFNLAFDQAAVYEQRTLASYRSSNAQDGAGYGRMFAANKGKIQMYVIGEPNGYEDYLHPDGSTDRAMSFIVVQVCDVGWKDCHEIQKSSSQGVMKKLFGLN